MKKRLEKVFFCFFILFVLVSAACSSVSHLKQKPFFSHEDAARLDLSDLDKKAQEEYFFKNLQAAKGFNIGPIIEIKHPEIRMAAFGPKIETASPVDLDILFSKNKNGHPVDMNSLEVIGKKGWFKKSLTAEIKPFIRGKMILAENLPIPKGTFHLQISIADTGGGKTVEDYILVVK